MLPVYVITSSYYAWALRPFAYLFNLFWSSQQDVTVLVYQRPNFSLPDNFRFFSVTTPDSGKHAWSTALIEFLNAQPTDHFVLMLEDYLLTRTVDHRGIETLHQYCKMYPDVLRMDLTNDVMHVHGDSRNAPELESFGHYDLVYKPADAQYRMSLQAAIWNKRLLLSLLEPGKSSWETEIHLSPPPEMKIVGSLQIPVRYANVIYQGTLQSSEVEKIPQPHRETIQRMIPKQWDAPNKDIL